MGRSLESIYGLSYYPAGKDVIYGFSESQFFLMKTGFRTSLQGPMPRLVNHCGDMQLHGVPVVASFPSYWDSEVEKGLILMITMMR